MIACFSTLGWMHIHIIPDNHNLHEYWSLSALVISLVIFLQFGTARKWLL
jgi:hypothetical protein